MEFPFLKWLWYRIASKVIDLYHVILYTLSCLSEVKMSRQTTLGHFGFKNSIPRPHRGIVTETVIPDFVSTAIKVIHLINYIFLKYS